MPTDYCLETAGLCHQYGAQEIALREVSLQVPDGSIYAFLGPNGAGKTTTLRLVLGLLKVQQGRIAIFGQAFAKNRREILRKIGSLIESPSLYEHLTARENLLVWQRIYQSPESRISEVLELVGLAQTKTKKAGRFSLGMKQRLGIAVALLHQPALLILDEPTNGLDPSGMIEMRDLLLSLNRERGVTILLSSHLLAEIEKLATHLGIIHRGRMVFQGPMGDLRQKQEQASSLCFRTSDNEKALSLIAKLAPGARRAKGEIVLPRLPAAEVAQINQTLVAAGVGVHEIQAKNDDLETIFMKLIAEPQS